MNLRDFPFAGGPHRRTVCSTITDRQVPTWRRPVLIQILLTPTRTTGALPVRSVTDFHVVSFGPEPPSSRDPLGPGLFPVHSRGSTSTLNLTDRRRRPLFLKKDFGVPTSVGTWDSPRVTKPSGRTLRHKLNLAQDQHFGVNQKLPREPLPFVVVMGVHQRLPGGRKTLRRRDPT